MKRNWIRRLIGGLSFTSVMFVFQACYGTPQDFGQDIYVEGVVKSKTTNLPIMGIKVSIADKMQYVYTNAEGKFSMYTEASISYKIKFEDIDASQNGLFLDRDTTISTIQEKVYLNIALENK